MPGCPVDCLRTVISGQVLNRLARADGRGVPVAPCGPPATVGDVVRLYRQGRLGEIAGLGARSITEIEAGLVFAGLLLDGSAPARRQPHARRTTAPVPAATTAGTKLPPAGRPDKATRPWPWLSLAGSPGAGRMSDSESIAAMQRELGRQLAALRREAGLTQRASRRWRGFPGPRYRWPR